VLLLCVEVGPRALSVVALRPLPETPWRQCDAEQTPTAYPKEDVQHLIPSVLPMIPCPPSDAVLSGDDEFLVTVGHDVLAAVAAEAHPSAAPLATSSVADSEAGLQQPKKKRRRTRDNAETPKRWERSGREVYNSNCQRASDG